MLKLGHRCSQAERENSGWIGVSWGSVGTQGGLMFE